MVMLTGIAFGPEAGFLCGAIGRLVCNMFQGQGVWTPWQMVSWGLLGAMSGVIFRKTSCSCKTSHPIKSLILPLVCIGISLLCALLLYYLTDSEYGFGWQFYAFGAVGFFSGLILRKKPLPRTPAVLSVYGFLATFIVYGGIMNICAMVMGSTVQATGITVSIQSLRLLYLSGVPYDAAHASGSAFFMFVIGCPILNKAQRIKEKYGIFQDSGEI